MATSQEELVDGLNTDLAHEYQSIVMYITYAATVRGMYREELKEFFMNEVPEEQRHAQFLAEKVSALGGTPATEMVEVPNATSPTAMLEAVHKAEKGAIERYVKRMHQAEDYGDYGLANDLHDLISDETNHKEDTEKLLRE
ncbi:MAG: ferritin-like domain-containing protein [Candidatus Bipolaricaulia bacterium]